jgi:hypothetical protein
MHHQDELAVGGRQQEPLGTPLDAAEALPVERGDRRVERLQRRNVGRPGVLDRRLLDERVELTAPGFDLGQLGQRRLPRWWTRSG